MLPLLDPDPATTDLQCVTVAVARSDVEEFRAIVRVYCARCAPDPDTAEATAGCEHGAIALRFRVCVPPSTAWEPTTRQARGELRRL